MTAVTPRPNTAARDRSREPISRRIFRLENPANVGPLIHVVLWWVFLAFGLFAPIATAWFVAVPLIAVLTLLNFSLTIGVLHMHTHRPLFVDRRLNRVVDVLCALPAALTGTEMREVHVLNHHRFNDGPGDVTSTEGRERGLGALWYWLRYGSIVKAHTIRELFAADVSDAKRKRRRQFVTDCSLVLAFMVITWLVAGTVEFTLFYWVPFLLTQVNSGYFAWLTHAPARQFEDDPSKSINTAGNILNFFIFNQGYHSVHHRYPGIHWSRIPDKLDFMREVRPDVIVPYWMTIQSAWRIATPARFLDSSYGERWKAKLEQRIEDGTVRPQRLRWFAWI